MLVLSRKLNETIVIDGNIRITVLDIRGRQVRLGIEAPDRVGIYREELCLSIPEAEACEPPPTQPKATRRPPVAPNPQPALSLLPGRLS